MGITRRSFFHGVAVSGLTAVLPVPTEHKPQTMPNADLLTTRINGISDHVPFLEIPGNTRISGDNVNTGIIVSRNLDD